MNVSPNNRPAQAQAQVSTTGRPGAAARPGAASGVRTSTIGPASPGSVAPTKAAQRPADGPTPPSRPEVASSLQRLDAYAESLEERLENAALDASPEESAAFREVADVLASGLERIRAGIADGSLAPQDIQRGTKVMFERSRQTLEAARNPAPAPSDVSGPPADAAADAAAPERPADPVAPDVAASDADAPAEETEESAAEANRELGRSILARLENLSADLLSMIDPESVRQRVGTLYGPTDGAEAITPRDRGMDFAG